MKETTASNSWCECPYAEVTAQTRQAAEQSARVLPKSSQAKAARSL